MMEINSNTKISEILNFNRQSIDAIASIAPPFKRLKNPILRKIMAPRVTVAEAAKMGKCTVEDFIKVLEPLGYRFVQNSINPISASEDSLEKPEWLKNALQSGITSFDVRPIIESGTDPLKEILHKLKEIEPGKVLCIINSFIPTPLIRLLEKDKVDNSFIESISDQEFHTYFLKKSNRNIPTEQRSEKVIMDDADSFAEICDKFANNKKSVIDVRDLEMPLPMQTILSALEKLPSDAALYVQHKRIPIYLLEELAESAYEIHIYNVEEGNVKMLLFKP